MLASHQNTKNAVIETFKSSPVIGSYLRLPEKISSIKDAIFLDKLDSFSEGMSDLSIEDVEKISNLNDDDLHKTILYYIDTVNQPWKARVLGEIFKKHIENSIEQNVLVKLFETVNKMHEDDFEECLWLLRGFYRAPDDQKYLYNNDVCNYLHYGLFSVKYKTQIEINEILAPISDRIYSKNDEEPVYYVPSPLGKDFFMAFKKSNGW
jgi:hypothetical protein